MSNWTKWEDVCIREDDHGRHYLLQQRRNTKSGRMQYVNRHMDKEHRWGIYKLFHGFQGLKQPSRGGE